MDNIFSKLAAAQKFLNMLTWKKIIQMSVFLLILAVFWMTYETRTSIYEFAIQSKLSIKTPVNVKLSKKTISEIIANVDKSDLIIGMQVTIVDFQKNRRMVIYTYTDDINIGKIWQEFESKGLIELPVFNSDIQNNRRMVDLINGEFICNPFSETIGAKLSPEAGKYVSTVCANGIPPFYGKFTGLVSVYTKKVPSSEEVDQIRTLTKSLSDAIYERDLK